VRLHLFRRLFQAAAVTCLALGGVAACAAPGSRAVSPSAIPSRGAAGHSMLRPGGRLAPGTFQHVVFIVQENRSFDNLFQGYPGADTVSVATGKSGQKIPLRPISLVNGYDIVHNLQSYLEAYDKGKMDGFGLEATQPKQLTSNHPQFGYVPQAETRLYFAMANQYVLADEMFPSNLDMSFVSHQYTIAAQSGMAVDSPSGYWGCDGGPKDTVSTITPQRKYGSPELSCFDYTTIADELEQKGLTWRYYAPAWNNTQGGLWSAFQAVKHIRQGPNWKTNVVWPETQILQDIPNGKLASVTWVTPDFANSDHPRSTTGNGPKWVASIVNAIGTSQFWNTTAIFVFWDDWGGWYDHVPPPQLDYDGLGIRVPMLCISPYSYQGVVSHTQYETSSILRFIEDQFGLAQLSTSDARATSAGVGCINPSAPQPRPFVPFVTTMKPEQFLHQKPSGRPPDQD
jgi:phospholipase C